MLPDNLLLAFLIIFVLRITDVSLGTLRTVFILHGWKPLATVTGFVEVTIFIFAISQVVSSVSHWALLFAYSGGFAVGTYIGLLLEERFALGFSQLRIISRDKGKEIAEALWREDFGATVVQGTGRSGLVGMISSVVPRAYLSQCVSVANKLDNKCFINVSDTRHISRGYLGQHKRK